jgi:hypothetical protein
MSSPIYTVDWSKYKGLKSYDEWIGLDTNLIRTFHTCEFLMDRKKRLEILIRQESNNKKLKRHFQIKFQNRKISFYRKIVYELIKNEETEIEREIVALTKDILFIYDKKKEELEYVQDMSNHYEAEASHREEMRESMIEDWRNCD